MNNPNLIIMVRPSNFGFNAETASSNKFQSTEQIQNSQEKALKEFDNMVEVLRRDQIDVRILQDTETPMKPDAIFPNNWISFHSDGQSVLYPMEAPNRRHERRLDVFDLVENYKAQQILDFTNFEGDGKYLEGTGSVIFDFNSKTAYCAQSTRSNLEVFELVCQQLGFRSVSFDARDIHGFQIYHTNVLLSIGDNIIVLCSECIEHLIEREMVKETLMNSGRTFIDVSFKQMEKFSANCLEVNDMDGNPKLIMSYTAYHALNEEQINLIQMKVKIVVVEIPTIETLGGGSARCMLLGVK